MILEDNEVVARLESPLNLLNRLRTITRNDVIGVNKNQTQSPIVSLPPSIDDLVDDVENKISTNKAYSGALAVLGSSIERLRDRIYEVDKPENLSRIATDMSKIVNGFDESKNPRGNNNPVIIYKPIISNESVFDVIYANE